MKIPKVALINDLVANAEGVERLQPQHLVPLNDGTAVYEGTRPIIAAGTGLGEGTLVWDSRPQGIPCRAVRRRPRRFLAAR